MSKQLVAWVLGVVGCATLLAACGDNTLPAKCGNGRVDQGETCDYSLVGFDCPADLAACDDGNACTTEAYSGSPTSCTATCTYTPVAAALGATDGCCPAGADVATDADCPFSCGNGIVEVGEACDTGITGPGECPTSCDDGLACTTDVLTGVGCQAACSNVAITAVGAADGCCPAGATSGTDQDCSAACDNGVLDIGETCDTAIPAGQPDACPTSCDDSDACTSDTLLSADTCSAVCQYVADVTPADGDSCCPAGANANTDNDCIPVCGNGALETAEFCDSGIGSGPGSCPASVADCDDALACTTDGFTGAGCVARCTHVTITATGVADSCCPAAGNAGNDPDCLAVCGNGVVEGSAGENCDTGLAGSCPATAADCGDGNLCTTDGVAGVGCARACTYTTVTSCAAVADGCCPAGCTGLNDGDCSLTCGNGTIEPGETCDTGAGSPTPCPSVPADCSDGDSCTTDSVQSPGTCNASCVHSTITATVDGDSCCPVGGNANIDDDCPAVCGNGAVEPGETCDSAVIGSCPTTCASDGDSCTNDALIGSAANCDAACPYTDIVPCCGNGVVDGTETCDKNAPPGPGACPTSCADANPCSTDTLTGSSATCDVVCTFPAVPPPCCGDGLVTSPETLTETCDDSYPGGPVSPRPCSAITCEDNIPCTSNTSLNLAGNSCRKICPHAAINDPGGPGVADSCCPPQSRFGDDADCVCGGLGTNAPIEQCDDMNAVNNDVCSNSCTYIDSPLDGDMDPTVADVVGAPCTGTGGDAGNCSLGAAFAAGTRCLTAATLPPLTNGVVNGYCSVAFCNDNVVDPDGPGGTMSAPNIATCPQLAPAAAIAAGMASPNALCVTLPGAPFGTCVALCSPAAGQNLCRRTELGPLSAVLGPALGGWAYRCQPISPSAGICVPRDPTF